MTNRKYEQISIKRFQTDNGILFQDTTFRVQKGDKVALLGDNGSGKTTLLKMLCGFISPAKGDFAKSTEFKNIGYVPQNPMDTLAGYNSFFDYLNESVEDFWEFEDIYQRYFGIFDGDLLRQPIINLSGGELTKMLIISQLMLNPDLFILDEPTNNLDTSGRNALMGILTKFRGALIFASHDLALIKNIADVICDIEEKKLNRYEMKFLEFIESKNAKRESQARQFESARKGLKKIKHAITQERKRAIRSENIVSKARSDRSMSAYEKGYFAEHAGQAAAANSNRLHRQLAEAETRVSDLSPAIHRKVILDVDMEPKKGLLAKIGGSLKITGGGILLDIPEISIYHGQRILLSGDNGSGKSSLLKIFCGIEGYILDISNILDPKKVIYWDQKYSMLDLQKTVFENIQVLTHGQISYEEMRKRLGNMLFRSDLDLDKLVSVLSGGEKAKLMMAALFFGQADIIILDEPTNNLDLSTVQEITKFILGYKGTLIVVSHDSSFTGQLKLETHWQIKDKMLTIKS